MIAKSVLQEMFEYNYWARDLQLAACAKLTSEQFLRPLGSSFSSVRDTLVHLVGTEWVYLERCRGRSPTIEDVKAFAPKRFSGVRAISEEWQSVERNLREYIAHLSEAKLEQPLTYVNLSGERWTYPQWRILFHLINHQTYHRGQVTTMLRQLGMQPPQIDFLVAQDVRFRR